jgi:transcriptional regulator with XRE-family HTH domain
MDEFITWLNVETETRGWTLHQIAQQTGVSRATISRIARGEVAPSAEFCRRIAMIFRVSPEEVYRRAGLLPPASDAHSQSLLQEATYLFSQLPSDQQDVLLAFVRALLVEHRDQQNPWNLRAHTTAP